MTFIPILLLTLIHKCMLLFFKKLILGQGVRQTDLNLSKYVQKRGEELLGANFNSLKNHK